MCDVSGILCDRAESTFLTFAHVPDKSPEDILSGLKILSPIRRFFFD